MKLLYLFTTLIFCTAPLCAQFVINEFHPTPAGGEPEWIELYNPSQKEVKLSKLFLHDTRTVISIEQIQIPGRGFLLISTDTFALRETRTIPPDVEMLEIKLPSLNNSTDVIVIRKSDRV